MKSKVQYLLLALLVAAVIGCTNAPNFPITPEIEFLGASKNAMIQNSLNTDSIFISISFTDGDGDIGGVTETSNQNIFITDNRTGEFYDQFRITDIPQQGASNGISGEIIMRLYTTCCLFPEDTSIPPCEAPIDFPTNELTLDISIMDRAGNMSNTITTDPIILLCD